VANIAAGTATNV